jgi:hypothetical protein
MINKIFFLVLFSTIATSLLYAQHDPTRQIESEERTAVYEIITSGLYAYNATTEKGASGTELHFTYWMNHVWGAGLGYTVLFEEENEKTHQLAILGSYNPKEWLTVNVGPNFRIPSTTEDLKISGYIETEFNYRLRKWLHFGPLIGATIGEEIDLAIGFQFGFEF